MDKIHLGIIAAIKLTVTSLAIAITLDTAIVPLMVSASQKIASNSYAVNELMKSLIMITVIICAIVLTFRSRKNNTEKNLDDMQVHGTPDETKTLLKVAYFDNIETMKEAAGTAIANNIFVPMTGLGKDTDDDIEEPFALFCDEKSEGADFFMKMGATRCVHHCTGAIA